MIKQMGDFYRRLLVSSISVAIIALLITFSPYFWVTIFVVLTVMGIVVVGVWEYAQLAHAKDLHVASFLMMAVAACFVAAFFGGICSAVLINLPFIVLAAGLAAFFLYHFRDTTNALPLLAVEFFGVCYVAMPLSLFLGILFFHSPTFLQDGRWWLVYLILVTKITDVGAYFVGRLWGKRRLAPILSPKKTVEGAVAGFVCATGASLLCALFGRLLSQGMFHLPLSHALILGSLIGIVGQVGDLAESLLKRDAVVKDSNKLPGLGGVLDMVDSLLLTAPIVYFYLKT